MFASRKRLQELAIILCLALLALASVSICFFAARGQDKSRDNPAGVQLAPESIQLVSPSDITNARHSYVLARKLQQNNTSSDSTKADGTSNNLEKALELFEDATTITELKECCQYHKGECLLALGKKAEAQEIFTSLYDANTAHHLQTAYYLGQIYFSQEKLPEALPYWREYISTCPDGYFALQIVSALNSSPDFKADSADYNLFACVYYAHKQWSEALSAWKHVDSMVSWSKQVYCLVKLAQIDQAKKLFITGITAPANDKDSASDKDLPLLANMLSRHMSQHQALLLWQHILRSSPARADVALFNIGSRTSKPAALRYYQQLVNQYPKSSFAPESAWWLTWDLIQHGHYNQALLQIKKYQRVFTTPRFAFWAGKLNEKLKHKEQAIACYKHTATTYPANYYGWRAQDRLLALSEQRKQQQTINYGCSYKNNSPWSWPAPPQTLLVEAGPTIATLAELEQWDECLELLDTRVSPLLKAFIWAKQNTPLPAINCASARLTGKPTDKDVWQLAYPLLYADKIGEYCNLYASKIPGKTLGHVEPLLAHAVIREESRYDPQALSNSKAMGLMQLLSGTAYGVAKHNGIKLSGKSNIYKPDINLRLGIAYLSYLLTRFEGNNIFAVASYNGGPNAVTHWSKANHSDLDFFVESIPKTETRDYVRKVLGSYWNYQAIYGKIPASSQN